MFVTWIRSYKHWLIHFLRCMILNRWTPHPLQIFNVCFMKRFFLYEKCGYYLKIETMCSQLYRIMEIFITRQQRLQTCMATYSSHRTTVPQYWWRFDEETKKWKKDRASLKIWNLEKGWRQYKVRCHWARKSWISKPPLMIGIRSREMVCSRIFRACHKLEAACTSSWLLVATCSLNAGFSIPFMAAETSLVVWSCKMLQYLPQDEDITVASEYQEEVHLDRTRGLIPGTKSSCFSSTKGGVIELVVCQVISCASPHVKVSFRYVRVPSFTTWRPGSFFWLAAVRICLQVVILERRCIHFTWPQKGQAKEPPNRPTPRCMESVPPPFNLCFLCSSDLVTCSLDQYNASGGRAHACPNTWEIYKCGDVVCRW